MRGLGTWDGGRKGTSTPLSDLSITNAKTFKNPNEIFRTSLQLSGKIEIRSEFSELHKN